jgi:hypothetical protein
MPPYEFDVEAPDGSRLGALSNHLALPEPGDVLELVSQGQINYWQVRHRRFTTGGYVAVIVDPVNSPGG